MTINGVVSDGCVGGRGLSLPVAAEPGAVLLRIDDGLPVRTASTYTVQVGRSRHLMSEKVRYLNHSCAPNVAVDVERLTVVALTAIQPGEELTFFYPATEWDMATPFACRCLAPGCLGVVRGARYLPAEVLNRHRLSPHVRALIAERDGSAGAVAP